MRAVKGAGLEGNCAKRLRQDKGCAHVQRNDSPRLMPFRALNLSPQILKAVQEAGYTEPTPIQAAAIPHILAGHDLIGIAQTGTGKTGALGLPILTRSAGSL